MPLMQGRSCIRLSPVCYILHNFHHRPAWLIELSALVSAYADDMALVCSDCNRDEVRARLQPMLLDYDYVMLDYDNVARRSSENASF